MIDASPDYNRYGNVLKYKYQDPATGATYAFTGSQWILLYKGTATAADQPSNNNNNNNNNNNKNKNKKSAKPSLSSINSVAEIYRLWMGDAWVAANKSVINNAAANSWTERMIIKDAAQRGPTRPMPLRW